MCCFSRAIERVSGTSIFVRSEGERQLVVYEMSLLAEGELAMVLPIPVALDAGEDAVEMVDLTHAPGFFGQLEAAFVPPMQSFGPPSRLAPQPAALKVHTVGDFEASFVPSALDFERLDPRFTIPRAVWDSIPEVSGFGFVVFELRDPAPAPGLLERVLGRRGSEPRRYHPMAFWFPRRDPERLFFPTLHIHDGAVHPEADFDHRLYAQASSTPPAWETSAASLRASTWGAAQHYVADAPAHRIAITGLHPNRDTWIAA